MTPVVPGFEVIIEGETLPSRQGASSLLWSEKLELQKPSDKKKISRDLTFKNKRGPTETQLNPDQKEVTVQDAPLTSSEWTTNIPDSTELRPNPAQGENSHKSNIPPTKPEEDTKQDTSTPATHEAPALIEDKRVSSESLNENSEGHKKKAPVTPPLDVVSGGEETKEADSKPDLGGVKEVPAAAEPQLPTSDEHGGFSPTTESSQTRGFRISKEKYTEELSKTGSFVRAPKYYGNQEFQDIAEEDAARGEHERIKPFSEPTDLTEGDALFSKPDIPHTKSGQENTSPAGESISAQPPFQTIQPLDSKEGEATSTGPEVSYTPTDIDEGEESQGEEPDSCSLNSNKHSSTARMSQGRSLAAEEGSSAVPGKMDVQDPSPKVSLKDIGIEPANEEASENVAKCTEGATTAGLPAISESSSEDKHNVTQVSEISENVQEQDLPDSTNTDVAGGTPSFDPPHEVSYPNSGGDTAVHHVVKHIYGKEYERDHLDRRPATPGPTDIHSGGVSKRGYPTQHDVESAVRIQPPAPNAVPRLSIYQGQPLILPANYGSQSMNWRNRYHQPPAVHALPHGVAHPWPTSSRSQLGEKQNMIAHEMQQAPTQMVHGHRFGATPGFAPWGWHSYPTVPHNAGPVPPFGFNWLNRPHMAPVPPPQQFVWVPQPPPQYQPSNQFVQNNARYSS